MQCMMHIDGATRIDAFMGHWHKTERDMRYPETCWRFGSLNTLPRRGLSTTWAWLNHNLHLHATIRGSEISEQSLEGASRCGSRLKSTSPCGASSFVRQRVSYSSSQQAI